jgi:flavin-binding protein dodecin
MEIMGESTGVAGNCLSVPGTATKRYTTPVVPLLAMTAVKIVKITGTAEESWQAAAEEAFREASRTIDDISGVEVEDWTAQVENDEITEYRATVEVAFPVHND